MNFKPEHFALTLPKGYAKEYRDRNWFNSIYFSKLSMYHEQEGYIPILYHFELQPLTKFDGPVPNSILMTFYYPQKRMSNLNGLVMIGGQPDIYQSYQMTRTLTPYLESLTLDEHGIDHRATVAVIEESLDQLSRPISIRSSQEIIERSQSKSGEDLTTFYPILGDNAYRKEQLSLPMDFAIDAVFMFKIEEEFFSGTEIGAGLQTMRMYGTSTMTTSPSLAFPLIFKWQPIYNDILNSLKNAKDMLPSNYEARLIPSAIIFDRQDSDQNTALISSIAEYEGQLYYHVAVANSESSGGQPLPLLQAALSREKFGKPSWIKKLDHLTSIPQDSIKQTYGEDLITSQLTLLVPETNLLTEGKFDLGKLRSIEVNR